MFRQTSSSNSMPAGRTSHACVQCRRRRHKCGGFTREIKCRPCTNRNVNCSFQEEVKDPRYNPYLRIRSPQSPTPSVGKSPPDHASPSSASESRISSLIAPSRGDVQALAADAELSKQVKSLQSRIVDLENRLTDAQFPARVGNAGVGSPWTSTTKQSFRYPTESGPSQQGHGHTPTIPRASFSDSNIENVNGGPLKTLNSVQIDDPVEFKVESHDPITRSLLTEDEACVMFRLYFSRCHPHAPFLDVSQDSDLSRVRSNSISLFLAILCVGARFWNASSRTTTWPHPRYGELIRLLDAEVMRLTMRSGPEDQKLETVQALILSAHWLPFEISTDGTRYRSRFSEARVWQCLGLAIRWSRFLRLERSCQLSFQHGETVTRLDAQRFRTMLFLLESDYYLSLSARRPSSLDPEMLKEGLSNFLCCNYHQTTDVRLACLYRAAYSAHTNGCQPTGIESVEAFDKDIQLIEEHFTSGLSDRSLDARSAYYPLTNFYWYRLSYACAFLDHNDPTQRTGKALAWAIEWASQILIHLAVPPPPPTDYTTLAAQLEPDLGVVDTISFANDIYFAIITYAAFFLVKCWLSNVMCLNLRTGVHEPDENIGEVASNSLLFRLVDVAARTLEAAAGTGGHTALRYTTILRAMTGIILSGRNTQSQRANGSDGTARMDSSNMGEQPQSNVDDDLWAIWQQAGGEPISWPIAFDTGYEG